MLLMDDACLPSCLQTFNAYSVDDPPMPVMVHTTECKKLTLFA
jgi:hypothetical protein